MSTPFPAKPNPVSDKYNGVDCYGGTPDEPQGKIANKFDDDVYSTGKLPKGVDEHFGVNNNEQPGNHN